MDELNGCEPMEIKVPSPFTFTIGDTKSMTPYKSGGIVTQVVYENWYVRLSDKLRHFVISEPTVSPSISFISIGQNAKEDGVSVLGGLFGRYGGARDFRLRQI